jgi:two-component system, cell cycle sensor histidine kinase and response regulator CckA
MPFPTNLKKTINPLQGKPDLDALLSAFGGFIFIGSQDYHILYMNDKLQERLGYLVLAASTPSEAIRLVEVSAAEIHLLLTDVIMPEMNGRDLAERLVPIKKGMKCLFMSGYTSDIIASQGVLVEGIPFIQKPFSQKELADRIRKVLNRDEGKEN